MLTDIEGAWSVDFRGIDETGAVAGGSQGLFRSESWDTSAQTPNAISRFGDVWNAGTNASLSDSMTARLSVFHDSVIGFSRGFETDYLQYGAGWPDWLDEDNLAPGASYIDGNGSGFRLTDPDEAARLADGAVFPRVPVVGDLNDLGDVAGWFGQLENSGSLIGEGFVWRQGAFSLVGGLADYSRFWRISNAGQILAEAYAFVENQDGYDSDGDGIDDSFVGNGTYSAQSRWGVLVPDNDTDHNGFPDDWETEFGVSDPNSDDDGDGLSAAREYALGTNPGSTDTDQDSAGDTVEIRYGNNPVNGLDAGEDRDGDGPDFNTEVAEATDPFQSDTDRDGIADGEELVIGTNPLDFDSDDDQIPDGWEITHGLDPNNPDDAETETPTAGITFLAQYLQENPPQTNGNPNPDGGDDGEPGAESRYLEVRTKHASWSKSRDQKINFLPSQAHGFTNGNFVGPVGESQNAAYQFSTNLTQGFVPQHRPPEAFALHTYDWWSVFHDDYLLERGNYQPYEIRWNRAYAGQSYLIVTKRKNLQSQSETVQVGVVTLSL
ncbi:MAG: hypothetical protein KDM91_22890, partial [Verrucomicrobiae bacterium]|nr:hypothetical protein [Verrucomicrobiae bacterium]